MSDDWTPGARAGTLTPEVGMLDLDGRRVEGCGTMLKQVSHWPGADLTDPATRYLALAQLARRVGLDPTWGVQFVHQQGDPRDPRLMAWRLGGWWLRVYGSRHFFEIDTDDPAEALDRALWATRGQP